ncbi:MAG: hypothetical protein R2789_10130 [Microthrixaceae bacterium]
MGVRAVGLLVLGLLGLAVAVSVPMGNTVGFVAPAAVTAATVAILLGSSMAGFVLYSHAAFSRNRSFLALGSTYLVVALSCSRVGALGSLDALGAERRGLDGSDPARRPTGAGIAVTALLANYGAVAVPSTRSGNHVRTAVAASVAVSVCLIAWSCIPDERHTTRCVGDGRGTQLDRVGRCRRNRFDPLQHRPAGWSAGACALSAASTIEMTHDR